MIQHVADAFEQEGLERIQPCQLSFLQEPPMKPGRQLGHHLALPGLLQKMKKLVGHLKWSQTCACVLQVHLHCQSGQSKWALAHCQCCAAAVTAAMPWLHALLFGLPHGLS
jgi:hypothetical protein